MARPRKAARLWLRKAKRDTKGRITRKAEWLILDGGRHISTGCGAEDRARAEEVLAERIGNKRKEEVVAQSTRRPLHLVPVAEVLARYMTVKKGKVAAPKELGSRVTSLLGFWGRMMVDDVTSVTRERYVETRKGQPWRLARPEKTGVSPRLTTAAAARRELEDLRAAINRAHKDRILTEKVHVFLPDENPGREEWLTEDEVETLCRIARRTPEMQRRHRGADKGCCCRRRSGRWLM